MIYALIGVAACSVGAVVLALRGYSRVTFRSLEPLSAATDALEIEIASVARTINTDDHSADHTARILDCERRLEDLVYAVAEGIKNVERTEARIRATVSRAKRELEENGLDHPGLTAEHHEIFPVDGTGSPEGGLLPMPQIMADAESSIPGVTPGQLARIRGY